MTFGEVIHYVPHPKAWPEPVHSIASLLLPLHSADRPGFQEILASNPLESHAAPTTRSYTTMDFQHLINSTAAELNALAELPHYGGVRSTIPSGLNFSMRLLTHCLWMFSSCKSQVYNVLY